jgi:hypothetical protein
MNADIPDSSAEDPGDDSPRGMRLTRQQVIAALARRWGEPQRHRETRYWVSDEGPCLVACVARGRTPVLRVHSGARNLVHFIEVGAEMDLACALSLLDDFRPGDHALGPPAALCLDLWECPPQAAWGSARAARKTSSELRAWSRALRASAAIASRVASALHQPKASEDELPNKGRQAG